MRAARCLAPLPPLLLALAAIGCTSQEAAPGGDGSLGFGAPGSLTAPAGAGSFRFGAASAATQIEDQNTRTDWYAWTLPSTEGGLGRSPFVGDASLGYTKALDDVELATALSLDSYRFSVEWARIEPERDQIDEAALAHYSALLDALIAAGVRPMVTLHHFSNPVWIDDPRDAECAAGPTDQNLCGWGHPQGGALVVEEFEEHVRLLAERFGDRVDDWGTLNEPVNYLFAAYGVGQFPPGKRQVFQLETAFMPVVRDYLEGSVRAYRALKELDQTDVDGDGSAAAVGLSLSVVDWEASRDGQPSTDPADIAARDAITYAYHHLVVSSLLDGTLDTDLDGEPDETHPEWAGALDWLGVQYYFRTGVTAKNGLLPVLNLTPCIFGLDLGSCLPALDPTHCVPSMVYEFHPAGLREILLDYAARWPALPLVVSEGGIATEVGRRRAENVVRSLEQIALAQAAGADVRGYYHWSLFDNFEWAEGFEPRFGLYHVDYDTYERTPTEGATVYGDVVRARRLTGEALAAYGGEGPMTPEPVNDTPYTYCNGR